jgi:hypothetical protein
MNRLDNSSVQETGGGRQVQVFCRMASDDPTKVGITFAGKGGSWEEHVPGVGSFNATTTSLFDHPVLVGQAAAHHGRCAAGKGDHCFERILGKGGFAACGCSPAALLSQSTIVCVPGRCASSPVSGRHIPPAGGCWSRPYVPGLQSGTKSKLSSSARLACRILLSPAQILSCGRCGSSGRSAAHRPNIDRMNCLPFAADLTTSLPNGIEQFKQSCLRHYPTMKVW